MLGLLPGAGGTQRLPRVVGLTKALDLMLTGKSLRADRARSMKLVDVVADPNALETAAVVVARQLASGKLTPSQRKRGLVDRVLEDWSFARDYVFKQARATVRAALPSPLQGWTKRADTTVLFSSAGGGVGWGRPVTRAADDERRSTSSRAATTRRRTRF